MMHTTTTDYISTDTAMGNGNKKITSPSFSADESQKNSTKFVNNKEVAKWSSDEVQHWIKQQCKKFDLKKATIEKFEMNGQALVLLTKHDFLRRSPDGGEILYYALQRLINPNKVNSASLNKGSLKNGSSGQHPRIVEISANNPESNYATDSSSQPIIEEPDDPPKIRRPPSAVQDDNDQDQQQPYTFFYNQARIRPTVITIPVDAAAAAFIHHQQQQTYPNQFMFAQPRVHPHLQVYEQNYMHPHLFQQFHRLTAVPEILVQEINPADLGNHSSDGLNEPTRGGNYGIDEPLFLVTLDGQQRVLNEEHVQQLIEEVYQQQAQRQNLQRQQRLYQQQQQQQYYQQQQQQQQYQQQQQHQYQQRQQQQYPQRQQYQPQEQHQNFQQQSHFY